MAGRKLDDVAEAASSAWLHRSSVTFLECAINLMLTHMSRDRVIEIMRQEIRMLKEMD